VSSGSRAGKTSHHTVVYDLQVPFESLKREARDRKANISVLQQASSKVAKLASAKDLQPASAIQALQQIRTDLQQQSQEVCTHLIEAGAAGQLRSVSEL
jgi:hypothetical protein